MHYTNVYNGIRTDNHLVRKGTLNHLAKLANNWAVLWVLLCAVHLTVCSYHVTYVFQSESTVYICLNIKELLARNMSDIWGSSDGNSTRAHKHLGCKWTLTHLAKLAKWLSYVVSTYLFGAFECMFFSCHVHVPEWINNLYLRECQGNPCLKQAQFLKFNWLQMDSNPQPLSL